MTLHQTPGHVSGTLQLHPTLDHEVVDHRTNYAFEAAKHPFLECTQNYCSCSN